MSPGRKPSRSPASTAGRDRMMRSTTPRSSSMRGMGDGQIGLAGAGRADAEHQLGALQRAHIGVLGRRAGVDRLLARGDLRRGQLALALQRRQRQLVVGGDAPCGSRRRRRTGRCRRPSAGGRRDDRARAAPARRPPDRPVIVSWLPRAADVDAELLLEPGPDSGRTGRKARWRAGCRRRSGRCAPCRTPPMPDWRATSSSSVALKRLSLYAASAVRPARANRLLARRRDSHTDNVTDFAGGFINNHRLQPGRAADASGRAGGRASRTARRSSCRPCRRLKSRCCSRKQRLQRAAAARP